MIDNQHAKGNVSSFLDTSTTSKNQVVTLSKHLQAIQEDKQQSV